MFSIHINLPFPQHSHRLEDAHWLNLLLILDGFIQLASSDLAQAQLGMTFRAKGDLGLCLNAGDGLLLGIRLALFVLGNEAGGNLGIVLELVGAAGLESWGPHFLLLSIRVLFITVEWRSEPVLVLFGQGHIAEEAEANGHQQGKWSHFVPVSPRCVDWSSGNVQHWFWAHNLFWFGRCCFVDWMS